MISVTASKTDGPEGEALLLAWRVGAEHVAGGRSLAYESTCTASEACIAADVLCGFWASELGRAESCDVPVVTPHGCFDVRAPLAFWRALSMMLEVVAARLHVGTLDAAQRVDLEADGQVVRSSAMIAGWQTMMQRS